MWLILNNRAPKWEVLQKKNFHGPGWCSLRKQAHETIKHLIILHSFTKEVCEEVEGMIGMKNVWEGGYIVEALKSWCSRNDTKKIKVLPLIIAWRVWLASNQNLFEGKETLPLLCAF
jgi:hypothetical protein